MFKQRRKTVQNIHTYKQEKQDNYEHTEIEIGVRCETLQQARTEDLLPSVIDKELNQAY